LQGDLIAPATRQALGAIAPEAFADHARLSANDRSEHRQAAGAFAEAVIGSVELIVEPDAERNLKKGRGDDASFVGRLRAGSRGFLQSRFTAGYER
jgi:hypothetical protein